MKKVFSTHELLLLVALTPAKFGESILGTIYVFLHSYIRSNQGGATGDVAQVRGIVTRFEGWASRSIPCQLLTYLQSQLP